MSQQDNWNKIKRSFATKRFGWIVTACGFIASLTTISSIYPPIGQSTTPTTLLSSITLEKCLVAVFAVLVFYTIRQKVLACLYRKKLEASKIKSQHSSTQKLEANRKLIYLYRESVCTAVSFCDMLWSLNKRLSKIRKEESKYELETLLNKQVPHVLTRLATNCAAMLSVVVNSPVHVSVKCLHGDVIWTRARSRSEFLSIRVEALDFFIATENTAFKEIIEGKLQYYLCNGLDKEVGYRNINENFKKFYNNTLVVPFHTRGETKKIMLFVCADSMSGEFDDKECVEIIETIGMQMQRIIQLQQELSSTRKSTAK